MHRTLGRGLIAVLFAALAFVPARATAANVDALLKDLRINALGGETPRPFALASLDGKKVSLDDLRGRPALLYFWATW